MNNQPKRTFAAGDVREIVEMLRGSPDISSESLAGMGYLADLLRHYESKSDADIEAEVRAFCREHPFFPSK